MYVSYNSFYVPGFVFSPCPRLFINITHPIFITFPRVIHYPYYRDREMEAHKVTELKRSRNKISTRSWVHHAVVPYQFYDNWEQIFMSMANKYLITLLC